ncbi:MAG: hypothetical protein JSV84_10515 [Gemmatimonadota bacterium]|nr:MAG: hypothetical protein JSV84_10515 [Gemmatimonadota bacterium]
MKRAIAVLISFTVLWCVPMNSSHAEDEGQAGAFTVEEVEGSALQKKSEKDTLIQVSVGEEISQDAVLRIAKDASLKLKKASGEIVVLGGPSQGELQDLLKAKTSPSEDFIKKTLSKIPAVEGDEKKVDISTQSTGLTRGAHSPRKSMPYIWKVKKNAAASEKK